MYLYILGNVNVRICDLNVYIIVTRTTSLSLCNQLAVGLSEYRRLQVVHTQVKQSLHMPFPQVQLAEWEQQLLEKELLHEQRIIKRKHAREEEIHI